MDAKHVFQFLRQQQAAEQGISYDDLIAAEVGTDLRRALWHTDTRAALRALWRNLRALREDAS